jgi:hypothetical protein
MESVTVQPSIFSEVDLEYFYNLPEVQQAKQQIDSKQQGVISFTIELTPIIRSILSEHFRINLDTVQSIPMRWIKGDTVPHIDTGSTTFDNTYLVYLTDSEGEFIIDNNSYSIQKGDGYIFSEGLYHGTMNTGSEPRLLLGPMSEEGTAVGIFGIGGDGGTTIYIRQSGSDVEYSADQTTWNTVFWPCLVTNTNTTLGLLHIEFITDITITAQYGYFLCGTGGAIQYGSSSLKTDGTRPIITIDNVLNYYSLIQNGGSGGNGENDIHVYNIEVRGINGSTLYNSGDESAGWIGFAYFGKGAINNYIINCSSTSDIIQYGGGIVGSYSGSEAGASLTIIGCSSSGEIGNYGGGIAGMNSGINGGSITCQSCWSTGAITDDAGGIIGKNAGINGGSCAITNCYSEGTIGISSGGICGSTSDGIISNCYSTGSVASQGGGIIGTGATSTVMNCYTTGNILDSLGGCIAGSGGTPTIINCYTTGTVTGGLGYIEGNSSTVPGTCFSEAKTGTPGIWNSVNANTVLQGIPMSIIGTTWVSSGVNQPYELYTMGYSPYTIENIVASALNRLHVVSLSAGNSTQSAIINGKVYTILDITNGDAGSYNTFSIDTNTGIISTTATTVPGVYTLYIRNNGSYNITEYTVTVTGSTISNATGELTVCCQTNVYSMNPQTSNYNNEIITHRQAGRVVDRDVDNFYVGIATGQRTAHSQPIFKSYYDYMQYLQGKHR